MALPEPVPAPDVASSRDAGVPRDVPNGLEVGYPPKAIPRRGPGYLALGAEDRREIVRLRNNLGHPEAGLFVKFLTERKAEPKFIRAAGDFSCSACLESVPKPKIARLSTGPYMWMGTLGILWGWT